MAYDDSEPGDETQSTQEPTESAFGDWLRQEMEKSGLTIQDLVERTNLTYTGIWNIVKGNTVSPRADTRSQLAQAIDANIPSEVETEIQQQSTPLPGFEWTDFTPTDLQTVPPESGVYVFF